MKKFLTNSDTKIPKPGLDILNLASKPGFSALLLFLLSSSVATAAWTDPTLAPGDFIKAVHITELRDNAVWGPNATVTGNISYTGGSVGIGTTTAPAGRLRVNGRTDVYAQADPIGWGFNLYSEDDSKLTSFQTSNSGLFRLRVDGTDVISSLSGNIGMGTNAPNEKLHVVGNARLTNGTYGRLYFGPSGTQYLHGDGGSATYHRSNHATVSQMIFQDLDGDTYGRVYGAQGDNIGFLDGDGHWAYYTQKDAAHYWRINNISKMTLNNSGQLDLPGSSAPTLGTHVATKSYVDSAVGGVGGDNLGNHTATTTLNMGGNLINFNGDIEEKISLWGDTYGIGIKSQTLGLHSARYVDFDLNAYGGTTNARISTSGTYDNFFAANGGNVGIGTTAPAGNLDVSGVGSKNVYIQTTSGSSHDANLYIRGARTTGQTLTSNIYFQNNGNTDKDLAQIAGSNDDASASTANGRLQFRTNTGSGLATHMTIRSSGNVGIGTETPTHKLDVRGQIRQVTNGTYDLWMQGGAASSGDDRNLAILGTDEDSGDRLYLNYASEYAGGTQIGGPVILSNQTPTASNHAATKAYVDSAVASIPGGDNLGAGGTTTGTLYASNGSNQGFIGQSTSNYSRWDSSGTTYYNKGGAWRYYMSTGSFSPYTNNTQSLGWSSNRWNNIYATNGNFSGTVAVATPTAAGHAATKAYADTRQARVTGTCAAGSSIRAIAANGTVTCETDDAGAGGDNLGNHTATAALAMGTHGITSSAGTIRDGNGGWVRTYGNTGWYNGTYGGGWNMVDSTWIRSYGNKSIITGGTAVMRADGGFQVDGVTVINGSAWVVGDRIQDGTVDSSEIQDNTLTAADLAAGSVGASEVANGSLTATDVNSTSIQSRVTGTCPAGQSIRAIAEGGTVTCEVDNTGADNLGNHTATQNISIGSYNITGNTSSVLTAGSFIYASDARLKENLIGIGNAADVLDLGTYRYDWKQNDTADIGVIAQEVEAIFPEFVHTNEEGYKAVDYAKLVVPLLEVTKTQEARIEALEMKLDALTN